jgi:CelD/BcsL family acetyltransferase involved in cellulose biosynthesis
VSAARLRPVTELSDTDISAWRELADQAVEPNPFLDPDFVLPAAEALRPRHLGLLVTTDGADWTACLPVTRARGWRRVPLRGLVTWRHLYCYLGTPLLRADAGDAAAGLLDAGRRESSSFLGLDLLGADGPVNAQLEQAQRALGAEPVEFGRFERASVNRRAQADYVGLSTKHRRELQRLRRRLEEKLGEELEARDRSDDEAAWDEFLAIEASGWKGEEGTALASSGHGDLFRELCRRFERRGSLRLFALQDGPRTIAMLCCLISGDTAFAFKLGVAPDLLEYSPGGQALVQYFDDFHADERLRRIDSCAEPGNQFANRLFPDRRPIRICAISRPGLSGFAARPALRGGAWLRRRLRS